MSNIVVSTSSNMDDPANLALNNSEVITINSGVILTCNSDHVYSQQAAYPSIINAVGTGKYLVDGRDVWWIPFDASSGNVPALSTYGSTDVEVSSVGVGEFLGIWANLGDEAPMTAGTALPSSGYVKLREKTGTIADNDVLTFTNNSATVTVNSATGGQRGWIKVKISNATSSHGYSGNVEMRGDWFDLGVGDGTTTQTMQFFLPWRCPGIQVETSAGSGVYEWWCNSINCSNRLDVTNASNRTFSCDTTGLITFTNRAVPNGAKVRCPNVVNGTDVGGNNKTRSNFNARGYIRLDKVISGHTVAPTTYAAMTIDFSESAFSQIILGSTGLFSVYFDVKVEDCAVSMIVADNACPPIHSLAANTITINKLYAATGCTQPIINLATTVNSTTITNSYCHSGQSTNGGAIRIDASDNITITNCDFISTGASYSTGSYFTNCSNGYISNSAFEPSGGPSVGTHGNMLSITGCTNLVFDNLNHPVNFNKATPYDYVSPFSNNNNVHFRNFGTVSNPYANFCGRGFLRGSGNTNCSLNKLYVAEVGSGWRTIQGNQNKNINVADYIPSTTTVPFYGTQTGTTRRKFGTSAVTTGKTSGKEIPMFNEYQASTTSITLIYIARENDENTEIESDVYSVLSGTPTFDDIDSVLYMPNLNDEITATWTYRIKGLTGFTNSAPSIGGVNTGNIEFAYDIDNGTGFSGTFKTLNGTNLSGETLNKDGFRLRLKFKTLTANSNNAIYRINIAATTTATDLANYPYPWSNPQIIVTQSLSSTLASIFNTSTGELLAVRSGSGTITLYPEYYSTVACALRINKAGYESIDTPITLTENFQTIPIQQIDTVVPDTNPGALGISVTIHSTPQQLGGLDFSISIVVTDGSSPATIAQYLSWQRAQDDYNLLGTAHNSALHEAVIPVGTGYETARGQVFGSAGATLKGVRVVDGSGNEIPGFARMQSDNGTYYSPAASYTLTVNNIVSGSRLLLRRTDTQAVIYNNIPGTTFTHTYTHTSDIPVEIVVRKATTSPYYQEWSTTTTLSNSNNTQTANQLSDE